MTPRRNPQAMQSTGPGDGGGRMKGAPGEGGLCGRASGRENWTAGHEARSVGRAGSGWNLQAVARMFLFS